MEQLTDSQVKIMGYATAATEHGTEAAPLSFNAMADELGLGRKTVVRNVRLLVDAGLLVKGEWTPAGHLYTCTIQSEQEPLAGHVVTHQEQDSIKVELVILKGSLT